LLVEEFSSNGEVCLNCLCQPRGQAQLLFMLLQFGKVELTHRQTPIGSSSR